MLIEYWLPLFNVQGKGLTRISLEYLMFKGSGCLKMGNNCFHFDLEYWQY